MVDGEVSPLSPPPPPREDCGVEGALEVDGSFKVCLCACEKESYCSLEKRISHSLLGQGVCVPPRKLMLRLSHIYRKDFA